METKRKGSTRNANHADGRVGKKERGRGGRGGTKKESPEPRKPIMSAYRFKEEGTRQPVNYGHVS